MPSKYVVMVDAQEGYEFNGETVLAVNRKQNIDQAIYNISSKYPQATIGVYELKELQKMKDKPTYAKYIVNDNGEILPV